jgi:hypothetical protein
MRGSTPSLAPRISAEVRNNLPSGRKPKIAATRRGLVSMYFFPGKNSVYLPS